MTSIADVQRESQGNQPIYFNDEEKGISLGVLYFGMGEMLNAIEAIHEIVSGMYNQYDLPCEYHGRLLLCKLGAEYLAKLQSELYPLADMRERRFTCRHFDGAPSVIEFEEGGAK